MSSSSAPSSPASLTFPTLPTEPTFKQKLADVLLDSEDDELPDRTFATGGSFTPPDPCLKIDDTPISLPLSPQAVESLAATFQPSPFGRGSATLIDESVRLCSQVDASRISLSSEFEEQVYEVVADISDTLGVYDSVDPNLYKLVLYRDGGFFVPHKDTEKEDGMFATLVVQLPCKHEEGGLVVWHRGEEKKFVNAKDSEKSYFYSAFFADCEHEVLTVSGNRLVLVYNLVRSGHEYPKSSPYMENKLREVTREWQKTKGAPNKLVVPMHHEYTEANLSFSLLKGRDAMFVDSLRTTELFEVFLALVQKTKRGSAEEEWYDRDPYAEVDDEEEEEEEDNESDQSDRSVEIARESPYVDTSGSHKMIECLGETYKTLEWVGEDDNPAPLGGIKINVDKELLGDDDPFTGEPDEEDYEVTGNEGATVDYYYQRAVIVFWPKSRRYANICSVRFGACVDELLSSTPGKPDTEEKLRTIVQYATENVQKARPYFVKLLDFACATKDVQSAQNMLTLFGKPEGNTFELSRTPSPWDLKSSSRGPGLSTRAHADAVFEGIKVCGFEETKGKVQAMVSATNSWRLHQCADFAIRLSKTQGFEKLCSLVANCTAHEALSRTDFADAKFDRISEMMLTLSCLTDLRYIFLTKTKSMDADMLSQVILALHKHRATAEGLTNLFEQLLREFSRKALVQNGKSCIKPYGKDHAGEIGDILSILLEPPKNECILGSFVQDIMDHGSEDILKKVLAKQKIATATGEAAVSRLAERRVSQLNMQKPVFSYRQPNAKMPGHKAVEDFLRSDRRVMEYKNFSGIKEARRFASNFGASFTTYRFEREGYSADARAEGLGSDASVVISKNEGIFRNQVNQHRADCEEFSRIRSLLLGAAATTASSVSIETDNENENGNGNGSKRRRVGERISTEVIDLTGE